MGLILAAGFFFKCDKCLSSIVIKPSFVKGFGRTSFIPASNQHRFQESGLEHLPCWKYIEISSLRIFEVIATMGVLSNCRIKCVADTPSRFGMMMSIRTKSYFAPEFILFTASKPSNCGILAFDGLSGWFHENPLTALSIEQWNAYKNFPPIRRQVGSSSTRRICGCRIQPGSIAVLFLRPSED